MDKLFIKPELGVNNIDNYIIRNAIFKNLIWGIDLMNGNLLDIGCGKMPYKKYILNNSNINNYVGLDIETGKDYDINVQADYLWDGINMPFENNQFDNAFGTEVLEHCPYPEIILKETNRVMRPNGIFFFTVPFLWNLHEVPHDEYRYTPFSLKRHLENSGFTDIEIYPTGGWHMSMAQMIGLWIKRAPMRKKYSRIIAKMALPIMKILINIGNREKVTFKDGQMITGLYGIARKK